jgi:hypothetical protein
MAMESRAIIAGGLSADQQGGVTHKVKMISLWQVPGPQRMGPSGPSTDGAVRAINYMTDLKVSAIQGGSRSDPGGGQIYSSCCACTALHAGLYLAAVEGQ